MRGSSFATLAAQAAGVTEEQAKKLRQEWLRQHPALQNIPLRTEIGRKVREALAPPTVLDVDFAEIERRLVDKPEAR